MESNDKRDLILKAAVQAFGTKGFHETKVEEIAEAAGVAKGTVYLYFKDKNNLLYEVARYFATQYLTRVAQVVTEQDSSIDQLKAFARFHISQLPHVAKYNKLFVVHMQQASKLQESDFKEKMRKQQVELMALIQEIIHRGIAAGELRDVNARDAAFLFFGSLHSYMHAAMIGIYEDAEAAADKAEDLVELVLRGIGNAQSR